MEFGFVGAVADAQGALHITGTGAIAGATWNSQGLASPSLGQKVAAVLGMELNLAGLVPGVATAAAIGSGLLDIGILAQEIHDCG